MGLHVLSLMPALAHSGRATEATWARLILGRASGSRCKTW